MKIPIHAFLQARNSGTLDEFGADSRRPWISRAIAEIRIVIHLSRVRPHVSSLPPTPPTQAPQSRRSYSRARPAVWLLVIGALTAGGIWGYLWWDEQPLRDANEALLRGESTQAMKIVQKYLKTHPPHDGALALKARIFVALGRYDEALELFAKVGPASLADIKSCAQAYLHLEQWVQAVGLLEQAVRLSPRDPDVLHEITAARAFLGQSKLAMETAKELAKIPGYEARGYVQVGSLERDRQNREKAINAWLKVLDFDPELKQIQIPGEVFYHDLGVLYLDDGDSKSALKMLEKSVQIKPMALGLVHRGQAKLQLGQKEAAIEDWKRALELEPSHREAREDLASAALDRRKPEEAREWLLPLAASPRVKSSTTYLLQRCAALQGNQADVEHWRKETAQLRKLERINVTVDHLLIESPQSFWAQVMRAYRFAEAGNWVQAEILVEPLRKNAVKQPFLKDFISAVDSHGTLPNLEKLPIK